ncbi:AMP-activated serine/threonine-protein kinase regulatory subunit [Malassezia cuniculi]|uniref:AMP-activated serine/threonine-protein kinase regulatory subunit n=1 Tax=Malassezia cuniculi TaxID=948313 RepID=A0AAF0EQP3_9BASI|nr:AMP-activated serine/threonine-protein kinase regulatory subunit [Malassezia cuniculi]
MAEPGARDAQTGGGLPPPASSPRTPVRRLDKRLANLKERHLMALGAIRRFLRTHSCYDVLPVSFRLVVLDTKLTIRSAVDVMWQNGIVSAPLWQSTLPRGPLHPAQPDGANAAVERPGFAGMITVNDIIHVIQYYYHTSQNYDHASLDVETFRLERLNEVEQTLNVPPPPLLWIGPLRPLAEAADLLVRTHARRVPLLDFDEQLGVETVVSVLTQYRLLKFIAMNCGETAGLKASIGSLGIGTYTYEHLLERKQRAPAARIKMCAPPPPGADKYYPLSTATLDTTVFDVVHMFSQQGISAVPILDETGDVVDIYESVDVITLVRTGAYHSLDFTIREALERRPPEHAGVACCSSDNSLASVFALLRHRRVHRVIVLKPDSNSVACGEPADLDSPPQRSRGTL